MYAEREVAEGGPTIPELVRQRWGVDLDGPVLSRFAEPGWSYREPVGRTCPHCAGELHSLRRPYESRGRTFHYVAVVCPACPQVFSLPDLGVRTYAKLRARSRRPAPEPVERGGRPVRPGYAQRSPAAAAGAAAAAAGRESWPSDLPVPAAGSERRALLWCKVTDPEWRPPTAALEAAEDVRVIVPDDPRFDALRTHLAEHGADCRSAPHWAEDEQLGTVGDLGGRTDLVAYPERDGLPVPGPAAFAARDAFAAQWDALDELPLGDEEFVPVGELVPQEWARLLPHPTFNPAQSAAVPAVLDGDGHLVVVAPTGAGKTPIGMVAALNTLAGRGGDGGGRRKAAWLVPQRSLTDELDRELDTWRRAGLRVVRLTGEFAVDAELIRQADVWVATTEKFESICRTGSLRAALAEVGCLVVDEIHLLGDPGRGPVLEALLARVREDSAQVRIVGLSATVANAEQVAEWLGARLIRTSWRPTRLTWQLPVLPPAADDPDRTVRTEARTKAAVRLVREFAGEGGRADEGPGSVLVFCGSKRGVRATALAVAADRGVDASGADADDAELVERLCTKAGVRLHYRDWPYKREAEQAFRARESDVLVATSTVAAGVNLPARAVVVRDTEIGLDRIEVSMVQQMFGRAGRVGAGERAGWAHLLCAPSERARWQARLAAGYTVNSAILDRLSDRLLAECVQGRLDTLRAAERWWTGTFAHHQGLRDPEPVQEAADFLADAGYLDRTRYGGGRDELHITELGKLTSRFMVEAELSATLDDALRGLPVPQHPDEAEELIIAQVSTRLPALEQAPFSERARNALLRVLRSGGRLDSGEPLSESSAGAADGGRAAPGELARAVLLLAANSPQAFRTRGGYILGIPVASMAGILEEAQRYLAWLGAQGPLGTVHPWVAVVAADLAQRIRWRALGPTRGAGRLLWMCERMATAPRAARLVPEMWRAARARGVASPDWPGGAPPRQCALTPEGYRELLAERATTGVRLAEEEGEVSLDAPPGVTLQLANGCATELRTTDGTPLRLPYPAPAAEDPGAGRLTAAVFTRGDRLGAGWLAAYNAVRG